MFNHILTLRCNKKVVEKFRKWCVKKGLIGQSLLREVMEAAPEGRLRIKKRQNERDGLDETYE